MMKRTILFLLFFFVFSFGVAICDEEPKEVYLDRDKAGLVEVKGTVNIVKEDGKTFEAREGAVLKDGDNVIVSDNSLCQIAFGKDLDKTVQLDGNTKAEMTPSKDIRLSLVKGRLFAVVKNLGKDEKFDVGTPVAVCAVRGTSFEIVVVVDEVNVSTYDGSVYVQSLEDYKKGLAAISWVNRGSRTNLRKGWAALAVVDLTPQDLQRGHRYEEAVWAVVADYRSRRGKKFYEGISYLDPSNLHPDSPWKNLDTMGEEEKQQKAKTEFEEYMKRKGKTKKSSNYGF